LTKKPQICYTLSEKWQFDNLVFYLLIKGKLRVIVGPRHKKGGLTKMLGEAKRQSLTSLMSRRLRCQRGN